MHRHNISSKLLEQDNTIENVTAKTSPFGQVLYVLVQEDHHHYINCHVSQRVQTHTFMFFLERIYGFNQWKRFKG
mgnify:CR=1 FL=1